MSPCASVNQRLSRRPVLEARYQLAPTQTQSPFSARTILAQLFRQFLDRPRPQHLDGRPGSSHAFGHFVKWQSLQVAKQDHLLVIGRQLFHGQRDRDLPFFASQNLARGFLR